MGGFWLAACGWNGPSWRLQGNHLNYRHIILDFTQKKDFLLLCVRAEVPGNGWACCRAACIMSGSHLPLIYNLTGESVCLCVKELYLVCLKSDRTSRVSVTSDINYHQTHPPGSPWQRGSSSAWGCRRRLFLWCSSCTQRLPGLCRVYGSSFHNLR